MENKEQYLYFQLFDYQHLHFLQVHFLLVLTVNYTVGPP